jgi:opacity protein-like surface antigen
MPAGGTYTGAILAAGIARNTKERDSKIRRRRIAMDVMKRVTKPAVLAVLLAVPGLSFAQQGMMQSLQPYAGLGVGISSNDDVEGDDEDTGFKIFGGATFNNAFGAEFSYVDLGQFQEAGVSDIEASAWALHALARLPFMNNQASVFGKLGMALATAEAFGTDDTSLELAYGVGAEYNFQRNLGVRAEWERFALGNNDALGDDTDFDLFSASLVVRFQ